MSLCHCVIELCYRIFTEVWQKGNYLIQTISQTQSLAYLKDYYIAMDVRCL